MRRTLRVYLGEAPRLIGTLRHDAQGAREGSAFEYDAAWLAAPDRFAIEPGLPLVAGWQLHKKSPQGSVFHGRVEAAVARWRTEGRALGMTDAELEPFADAFEHAERSAAQRIAG